MASLLSSSLFVTWLCGVSAIPLDQFYPFGEDVGDAINTEVLDGSSPPITLSRAFYFYGKDYFTVVVNNSGVISFQRPFSAYIPVPFPLNGTDVLIAPYWSDVDTSSENGGTVWYRESNAQEDITRAHDDIRAAYREARDSNFAPCSVFIATWDHVGYYSRKDDKNNTFQCVLASDGFMSYVIFLYADGLIQWTTGDVSGVNGLGGNQAQVGFNAGDDEMRFYNHPDSRTANIINITSTKFPDVEGVESGVLIFRVDKINLSCLSDFKLL